MLGRGWQELRPGSSSQPSSTPACLILASQVPRPHLLWLSGVEAWGRGIRAQLQEAGAGALPGSSLGSLPAQHRPESV